MKYDVFIGFASRGYLGTIKQEDDGYYGRLVLERDLISYEAPTLVLLKNEFLKAVDSYLELCLKVGKKLERSYDIKQLEGENNDKE